MQAFIDRLLLKLIGIKRYERMGENLTLGDFPRFQAYCVAHEKWHEKYWPQIEARVFGKLFGESRG